MSLNFFLAFLLAFSFVQSQELSPTKIFLLAGQSNMAGRGGVNNDTWNMLIPPESTPSPFILQLSRNKTWVVAHEPLHKDIDSTKVCGVGPGMPFAHEILAEDPNFGVIGLVPCAIGGTNITQWAKGSNNYRHLVERADASLRSGGKIEALLWYQGESDTQDQTDANMYKERLYNFFTNIRSDLNCPNLPIIQVALASGYNPTLEEIVRAVQLENDLPNLQTVDAKGLPLEGDRLHLSTPAQVQLGKMLADAFLNNFPKPIQ
ncbi:putative carbohydrate esterase At4g34215 [Castanea sativa]|uniref:putative carbohydrate esterase At4g34215 n=1 Tax=Castanea sativa TaxID=21020 RepID=UPI003F64B5C0